MEPKKEMNTPTEETEETKELNVEELSQVAGGGKPIPLPIISDVERK